MFLYYPSIIGKLTAFSAKANWATGRASRPVKRTERRISPQQLWQHLH